MLVYSSASMNKLPAIINILFVIMIIPITPAGEMKDIMIPGAHLVLTTREHVSSVDGEIQNMAYVLFLVSVTRMCTISSLSGDGRYTIMPIYRVRVDNSPRPALAISAVSESLTSPHIFSCFPWNAKTSLSSSVLSASSGTSTDSESD